MFLFYIIIVRRNNMKFDKNYRSVELLMAVYMTPVYSTDVIDEKLYDKCWEANEWFNKNIPGFLAPDGNSFKDFIIKHLNSLGIKANRILFSFTMKRGYQKAMNYVHDNFTMDELKLLFDVYKEQSGGHSAAIDYIFNRI